MIYELTDRESFNKVAEIVNSSESNNSFARSVLEGNNLGWVFVDDKDRPTSAIVWPKAIGCAEVVFVGDHLNSRFVEDVAAFVDAELKERMLALGIRYFEYYGDHSHWNDILDKMFNNRKVSRENMLRYRFTGDKQKIGAVIAEGYTVMPIEQALLDNHEIKNKEGLVSIIKSTWGSVENFLNLSYGYVVVYDSTIAGWCTGYCRGGKFVQIDIEIVEEHWNRRLGTALAEKLVEESLGRGDIPEWQASEATAASQKIAERVGFTYSSIYPVFQLKL